MNIIEGQPVNIIVDGKTVSALFVKWEDNGAATVTHKGKNIVRTVRDGEGKVIRPVGVLKVATKDHTHYSIDQRFQFLADYTDMTIDGENNAFIVAGEGGLGKTFTIMARLSAHGKVEKLIDDETGELGEGDFVVVKGATTPKALYDCLYKHRKDMILFDDCDDAFKDKKSINILKAALDSYAVRRISWLSSKEDINIPQIFEFTGKVIFLTNLETANIPQPLRSRCIFVDVSMTRHEKFERMRTISKEIDNGLEQALKDELINFLESIKGPMNELSMRTFMKCCMLINRFPTSWKDYVRYTVTAK